MNTRGPSLRFSRRKQKMRIPAPDWPTKDPGVLLAASQPLLVDGQHLSRVEISINPTEDEIKIFVEALLRLNIKDNIFLGGGGSPVSGAPPLPALAPSPWCPFVPGAGRTEDARLQDTNTEVTVDHRAESRRLSEGSRML